MLGHKINLSKSERTEIISGIFSNHNTARLKTNYKKKTTSKYTNTWRLSNMLLDSQWITEKSQMKKILK